MLWKKNFRHLEYYHGNVIHLFPIVSSEIQLLAFSLLMIKNQTRISSNNVNHIFLNVLLIILLSINFQEFSLTPIWFLLSSIKPYHSIFLSSFIPFLIVSTYCVVRKGSIEGQNNTMWRIVFQQTTVILIGNNCAPLSADLFL